MPAKARGARAAPGQGTTDWCRHAEEVLRRELPGRPLAVYGSVTSTNDLLKEEALHGAPEGRCLLAREQTRGRGQRGRPWHSIAGLGVYLSVLLRPRWSGGDAGWLAMLAAVAAAEALDGLGVPAVALKWPNDVRAGGKKIGGVLIESRLNRGAIDFAVVGIGINVFHAVDDLDKAIRETTTSCRLEGVETGCAEVAAAVLKRLEAWYTRLASNRFEPLVKRWTDYGGTMDLQGRGRGTRARGP